MVWQAYKKVKSNKGSAGIDRMDWEELDSDLTSHLYKLWNRLTSGSYFPVPVKRVEISKKDGAVSANWGYRPFLTVSPSR
ncbi:hypothetical protein [Cyclobacterium xiamenense]|uniref:hypothetical protein n=1 Tax=Cyclobacterium xiamenense TaxID=1297121 RepID=UPI001FCFAA12|nr:hypothetical protein [Cyclobacterium xiamenense]